jgi:hypothetical protein
LYPTHGRPYPASDDQESQRKEIRELRAELSRATPGTAAPAAPAMSEAVAVRELERLTSALVAGVLGIADGDLFA